jgi:hypothetical protein
VPAATLLKFAMTVPPFEVPGGVQLGEHAEKLTPDGRTIEIVGLIPGPVAVKALTAKLTACPLPTGSGDATND